jgi:hypothetical protein
MANEPQDEELGIEIAVEHGLKVELDVSQRVRQRCRGAAQVEAVDTMPQT